MKVTDPIQDEVLAVVQKIRRRHSNWPVIVAQTSLHALYPRGIGHPSVYPYDGGSDISNAPMLQELTRAIRFQRSLIGSEWRGSPPIFVPIDFTQPEDGYAPVTFGLDALKDALEKAGVPTRVLSAIEMRAVAEPFIPRRAVRHLEKGRVVIFGAGTGNPYFTTDTAAALRAAEMRTDVILKGTKVDGIYTADPMIDKTAQRYDRISYLEVLERQLKVMDATAISLCMDNDLPLLVFNMQDEGNLARILSGEHVGTVVSSPA